MIVELIGWALAAAGVAFGFYQAGDPEQGKRLLTLLLAVWFGIIWPFTVGYAAARKLTE